MKKSFQELENEIRKETGELIRDLRQNDPELKAVYVPMLPPKEQVEYIFIAMEPSFGRWAKGDEEIARIQITKGFQNFLRSGEDFCFNYSIFNFLSHSYYLTDVSKIAMLVRIANKLRKKIYPRCLELLKKEIDVIGLPNAKILFVGDGIEKFFAKNELDKTIEKRKVIGTVPHYSNQSSTCRKIAPMIFRKEYKEFSENIKEEHFKQFMHKLLEDKGVSQEMIDEIFNEYKNKKILTPSRKELIFTYKKIFESLK
jgi:hypothetical protein